MSLNAEERSEPVENGVPAKKRSYIKPWVRVLAVFLAFLMIFDIWITGMIRIKESDEAYIGQFLELAKNTTSSTTEYLKESDFRRAWRILSHTIGKPDSYEDFETFASVAIAQEDYEKAVGYMQGCIDTAAVSDDELAVLYLRLGSLQMLSGEGFYPDAKASFTSAVGLDPTLANAWLLKAQLELEDGDYEAAVSDVTKYKEYGDDKEIMAAVGPLYEAVGDYETAIECYDLAADDPNGCDPEVYKSRGNCRLQLEDTEKAVADFERFFDAGGIDPDGTVWMLIALGRIELGRYEKAPDAFDRAVLRGYDPTGFYAQMIPCAYACADYGRVISYCDAAIALEDETKGTYTTAEMSQWYMWKGLALLAQNDFTTSLAELEKAIKLDDSAQDIYYYAATAALSAEKYERAVQLYSRSIERGESTENCIYNRGVCYVSLGAYENALEDFKWTVENGTDESCIAASQEVIAAIEEALGEQAEQQDEK